MDPKPVKGPDGEWWVYYNSGDGERARVGVMRHDEHAMPRPGQSGYGHGTHAVMTLSADFAHTAANGFETVPFDTRNHDRYADADGAVNGITVRQRGVYLVTATVRWEDVAAGEVLNIRLARSGNVVPGSTQRYVADGSTQEHQQTVVTDLVGASNTFTVEVRNDFADATIGSVQGVTSLQVVHVGASYR